MAKQSGFSFSVDIKGWLNAINEMNEYTKKETAKIIKKEINRTLQTANRRAQNIENSKIASPAYKSLVNELSETKAKRFSKFSIGGLDLTDESQRVKAIDTYSRALSFLNNKTSSATGARKFIKDLANKNNIPFDIANDLVDEITDPKLTNGKILVNNWDSERVSNMVSEFAEDYNDTANSKQDFFEKVRNEIEQAFNDVQIGQNIDIWDL